MDVTESGHGFCHLMEKYDKKYGYCYIVCFASLPGDSGLEVNTLSSGKDKFSSANLH